MKIGDKVRFLFTTGGGRIAAIKGNIVMVEDEDGFQIPTPVNEVVVEGGQDAYSTSHMVEAMNKAESRRQPKPDGRSMKAMISEGMDEPVDTTVDDDPALGEITFHAPVEERKGGNLVTAILAYVPVDIKQVTNTRFETYLVNDSNYFLHYIYLSAENQSWTVRAEGTLEPNTKECVEEIEQCDVNALSRVCIQLTAFKREKPFALKQPVSVQLRVDPVKFYKVHVFQPSEFFEQSALLYPIVEQDRPTRSIDVDTETLKAAMFAEAEAEKPLPKPVRKGLEDAMVVDLHVEKLLDNTGGMSSSDILNYQLDHFRTVMKQHARERGRRIVFIHGKGEGVLRHAILHELQYRYRSCAWQDASFQEYGYGATQVTIK